MIGKPFRKFLLPLAISFLFSASSIAETITCEYDNHNRIVKMEKSDDYVIEYFYDDAGNRTQTITQVQSPVFDHDSDADIDGADLQHFILNFSGSTGDLFDFSQIFGTQN